MALRGGTRAGALNQQQALSSATLTLMTPASAPSRGGALLVPHRTQPPEQTRSLDDLLEVEATHELHTIDDGQR